MHKAQEHFRARRFTVALALTVASMLVSSGLVSAQQPLMEVRHFDITAKAVAASQICGFDIFRHMEGSSRYTVFYDNTGAIVREVDTFPSATITVYAPSRGTSYTSAQPAVLTQYYTNGAAIGSAATAVLTGLQEKFGDIQVAAGRLEYSATVIRYDAAGVPVIRGIEVLESDGPSLVNVAQLRCDALR